MRTPRWIANRRHGVRAGLLICTSVAAAAAGCAGSAASAGGAGGSPAKALLARAIAFHDPDDLWARAELSFRVEHSRPNRASRYTDLTLRNGGAETRFRTVRRDVPVDVTVVGNRVEAALLHGEPAAADELDRLNLGPDQLLRTRDYNVYLYGLPMKLRDPGTRLDPEVRETDFNGRPAHAIRVTYDPVVGDDTWYFYFDPATAEMIGYRFYHDETKNDGEYIVLEGLAPVGGLRLPASRTWYTHQDDRLLGVDTIVR